MDNESLEFGENVTDIGDEDDDLVDNFDSLSDTINWLAKIGEKAECLLLEIEEDDEEDTERGGVVEVFWKMCFKFFLDASSHASNNK